jgi:hypothetical protein
MQSLDLSRQFEIANQSDLNSSINSELLGQRQPEEDDGGDGEGQQN